MGRSGLLHGWNVSWNLWICTVIWEWPHQYRHTTRINERKRWLSHLWRSWEDKILSNLKRNQKLGKENYFELSECSESGLSWPVQIPPSIPDLLVSYTEYLASGILRALLFCWLIVVTTSISGRLFLGVYLLSSSNSWRKFHWTGVCLKPQHTPLEAKFLLLGRIDWEYMVLVLILTPFVLYPNTCLEKIFSTYSNQCWKRWKEQRRFQSVILIHLLCDNWNWSREYRKLTSQLSRPKFAGSHWIFLWLV